MIAVEVYISDVSCCCVLIAEEFLVNLVQETAAFPKACSVALHMLITACLFVERNNMGSFGFSFTEPTVHAHRLFSEKREGALHKVTYLK